MSWPRPDDPAVVVTGVSVLTPLGDGLQTLAGALGEGRDAIAPASDPAGGAETRIAGFEAARYANVRGMRVYHRTTQLGICATKLSLDDAGLKPEQLEPARFGVINASTYAHLDTLLAYDEGLVTLGIQRTNPTLMPLGLHSAPGAAVALAFGAKAFSVTLSDGGAAGLAALGLGARMLADRRADVCVVVGAMGPCRELAASATEASFAASAEEFAVLDERACGLAFGEASAALVLERADSAHARGAQPKLAIAGLASAFAPEPAGLDHALGRACAGSLRLAGIEPGQLALVSTGANGLRAHDDAHARALLALLGPAAGCTPLLATKANLGETFDVSGLLQSVAALAALRLGVAPPIARLRRPRAPGLCCPREPTALAPGRALVTATSFTGACSALVLEQPDER